MNGERGVVNDSQKVACDGAASKRPLSRQSVKTSERMRTLIRCLADQGMISKANKEAAIQEVDVSVRRNRKQCCSIGIRFRKQR